jgi:phage-related protein (TIGR01555 family)
MENSLHENSMMDFMNGLTANSSSTESLAYNNRFYAITLNRALLSQTYLEHGIIQVLIDQPIDDAFRGGITISSPELSADDLKKLDAFIAMNQIIETYAQALKWSRLYGGAGIIVNAGQDMTKPLNINSIKERTPLEFYAVDRWELSYSPSGMSMVDQFKLDDTLDCPYNYYGQPLHKENVIKIKNKEAPSLIRGQFAGWGVSEVEKIMRSYNQYLKHQNVTYEILDESKVDVFKISGFNSAIATRDGAQKTATRISAASKIKNYQNALVVDKEDDYEQKTLGFAGVSEILSQIRIGLACDLRMPMTKLFGLSASGFNSGLDDIENYNGMIESEIRSKVKLGLLKVISICSQKTLGYIPENLAFEFKPLRIVNAEQESAMKTNALNRITTAVNSGLCTSEKAVELINGEKIFCSELDENEAISLDELKKMGVDKLESANETSVAGTSEL